MSHQRRSLLHWVILGLLAALVVTNLVFLILLRTAGPLIGLVFYSTLLARTLRATQRDYRCAMVGGLVGLLVHVIEVVSMGWSAYPGLVVLNLVLPAGLASAAWVADRGPRRVAGNK
ncbi:MAG: hypothetical protein PVJ26_20065 [Anaerolineae bacterium]|jgi:hypothetical protein